MDVICGPDNAAQDKLSEEVIHNRDQLPTISPWLLRLTFHPPEIPAAFHYVRIVVATKLGNR